MQATEQVRPGYRAIGNQVLVYNACLLDDVSPEFFETDYWHSQAAVVGEAPGRGTTMFVRHADDELALRHYQRGGGVGRLIQDSYWFSGLTATRPWREWHMLMAMHNQGLPVCVPVAARIIRGRCRYRADLMTRRIPDARAWLDCMQDAALNADAWVALGKRLRHFHNAGVYHHDLNVRNILRNSSGQIFLIDFDKSRFRKPGGWQRANLARLLRSIRKVSQQLPARSFSEENWGQLMQGYASAA